MKKLTTATALVLGLGFAIAQQTNPPAKANQSTAKPAKMTKAPEAKTQNTKTAKASKKEGMTDKKAPTK
nr:hypothetical protein [uncultured Chryseobacterium sp.]